MRNEETALDGLLQEAFNDLLEASCLLLKCLNIASKGVRIGHGTDEIDHSLVGLVHLFDGLADTSVR